MIFTSNSKSSSYIETYENKELKSKALTKKTTDFTLESKMHKYIYLCIYILNNIIQQIHKYTWLEYVLCAAIGETLTRLCQKLAVVCERDEWVIIVVRCQYALCRLVASESAMQPACDASMNSMMICLCPSSRSTTAALSCLCENCGLERRRATD